MRTLRRAPEAETERYLSETGVWFRVFLVWITFPPMLLLTMGQPVTLILIYAALGAFFMPFMSVTLLWLLNRRVPQAHRNGWLSNAFLCACVLLFVGLALQELVDLIP